MATFELKVACAGNLDAACLPELPIQVPTPDGERLSLDEQFARASDRRIRIHQDAASLGDPFLPSQESVSAHELQMILRQITGNPAQTVPVPNLGLIFAHSYGPSPDVYGLMFDEGIIDRVGAPVDPDADRTPREGCAVFIGAIFKGKLRGNDYANQVALTCVHELGHVFNLQHVTTPACFMNTSKLTAPRPKVFNFTPEQMAHLARVDSDRRVAPGGDPFGQLGLFAGADRPRRRRCVDENCIELRVQISPREFWPWEPVEMDVKLRAPRKKGQPGAFEAVHLPNKLDPGYRAFEIWIEEPSGERRRYRAPKHYCAFPSALALAPGDKWSRDISIFSEAGGYTFRTAGIHKIWVRFFPSPSTEMVSNECEVMVKRPLLADRRAQERLDEMERLLRLAQHTLYYRSGVPRRTEILALEELAHRHKGDHVGAAALYALGRFWSSHTRGDLARKAEPLARKFLARARDHQELSAQRRWNSDHHLEKLKAAKTS
jgi:hypothetical protein